MWKKTIIGLSIVAFWSCGKKETPLYVPYEAPLPPEIIYIVKQDQNCSMPFNVKLIASVQNELGDEHYLWNVNGSNYTTKSPTIQVTQTGTVKVSLTVSNSIGSDTYSIDYDYPSTTLPVIPNFNYGALNNNYRVPAIIDFTDISQRATGVSWDFGDGYQSSLKNPQHTYQTPGNYTVTLTAWCDSDTAKQTAQLTILPEPSILNFRRFDVLSFPRNYFPENQDDNTYGGDFYVTLLRDNFQYGISDKYSNRSKLPLYWRCPEEWNGDYKLIYYKLGTYSAQLWDQNDGDDAQVMNAIFDGNYLRSNQYPTTLDFQAGDLKFRIYLDYED
ncbi:MAG: PKD domain-containing protein [Bacteroidota bacterium]|nr:PKD domain-containing protein [Bacteroidota bacterium]MDX5429781.1 PKD domain-containing protein [Bacteroidota bacterium]MDX5468560.1 PKD domain-containing protein [Bacteroidota bacterium]